MLFSLGLLLLATAPPVERIPMGEGSVEVWRSHSLLEGTHAGIERAFVMVHGTGRNADEYFRWSLGATMVANEVERTVVVAPHFKSRTLAGRGDEVSPGELFWSSEGWKSGASALNGRAFSYAVMDRLVELLRDSKRFPDLKEIVIAGHSAGGQLVQRYAAFNRMEQKSRVPMRYVVANPSSYVYLNDQRPSGAGFSAYADASNCVTYNQYRYGLEKLTGYAALTSPEAVRAQYPGRKVTYLVGELDVQLDDPNLDRSCPANAQGANRRERGQAFWNYTRSQFGAQHEFAIAPGCGHSAVCVFAGPAGVKAVFGK